MALSFRRTSIRGLTVFAFLLATLPAQNPTPLSNPEEKIEAAKAYTTEKRYDDAMAAYRSAIDTYKNDDSLTQMLTVQRSLAKLLGDTMQQPVKGLEYLKTEALPALFRPPHTEAECKAYCLLLIRKSSFEKTIGDFEAVKADLLKALPYLDHQLKEVDPGIAEFIFRELGNAFVRLGEYEGAEKVFQHNIRYAAARKMPEIVLYNDYGSVYLGMKNYPQAIKIFEEGIREPAVSYTDKVILYSNIADYQIQTNQLDAALATNRKAEALLSKMDKTWDRYDRCQFCVLENYGMIHLAKAQAGDTSQFALAENRYRQAIEVATQGEQTFKREIAGFQIGLGEIFEGQGKYAEALTWYQEALQLLLPGFHGDTQALPDADLLTPENFLIRSLEGKANCFLALGETENALRCHELIPIIVAQLIATHAYETSSLRALDEGRARFDKGVAIAWQLYAKTGNRQYAERAFSLTEQARAVLLLQSIAKARRDFDLPANIRQQESELESSVAWYEQRIATEKKAANPNKEDLEKWGKDLFDLKNKQQQLKDRIQKEYPDYADLRTQLEFISAGKVARLLRKDQAMIDFYLTDTDAYIFYFNKKGDFQPSKVALSSTFREEMFRYFGYVSNRNKELDAKKWFLNQSLAWYDLLLRPVLEKDPEQPEHLLIVPDDVLTLVPFDVWLTQPADPAANWREYEWLIRRHSIAYAYSATLWEMQQRLSADHRRKNRPKYDFAGFAPTYDRQHPNSDPARSVPIPDSLISNLPNTRLELEKANAIMNGLAFFDTTASERTFKQVAPDCNVLLLAMHGLANDEYPELSCLLFGMPKSDSIDNDVLFSNELQIMRLQANLAVLSACHTGFGKLHKGEGVYSLARAFAVAGVPSIVMSLWRLDDNTAPLLTEAFFKHLKAGKTKDEALWMAKKEFLENNENFASTHPYYWAGVTVSGDMCPLEESTWWYWLLGGVALLAILAAFVAWNRKNRTFSRKS